MKDFSKSLIAVSLFASNILFWSESGYFDTAAEFKPLLHTWSLAVEEQYYVFFPLFLSLFWRLGQRLILKFLVIIGLTSLALAQWASIAKPDAAFYLLPTRGWELLIGAFAAFYLSKADHIQFSRKTEEFGGWLGLTLILFSVFVYSKTTPFPGFYALAPTIGTVLIILFATQQTSIGKFVGNKAFVGIGLISFSAYLWHQPLFAFARHKNLSDQGHYLFTTLSLTSLVLAYFTWRYVEKPFRNKLLFKRKVIFLLGFFLSVFFIIFGYFGQKQQGFYQRFERILSGDIGHIEFFHYIDERYLNCEPNIIADQALKYEGVLRCKQSSKGIPEIVVLGDSHAEHLFLGLAQAKSDLNVAFYILGEKPYIDNVAFKVIFDEILSNKKPQHIVLTMHFVGRLSGDMADLYDGFSSTIKALLGAGKRVTLVGDIPTFSQEPANCVYNIPMANAASSCFISLDDVEAQRGIYRSTLRRLSAEYKINYIEIDELLCSESQCGMVLENSVLYRDKNHLNILGSKLVGAYLAERLSF